VEQDLKAAHDRLLANKPDDVVHPPCQFCKADTPGGTVEFTPEQLAEIEKRTTAAVAGAVATATASLNAELEELKKGSEEAAIQAKIDEAVAKAAGDTAELQAKLDEAVAAQTAAEKLLADTTAFLEAEAAAAKEKEEADARKDARVAEVAAVIAFPDKHVEASADRWAEMADEAFAAELEGYKVLAEEHGLKPKAKPAVADEGSTAPKGRTAMTAAATPPAKPAGRKFAGAEAMGLRVRNGIRASELVN
jgi:hypothetical protein